MPQRLNLATVGSAEIIIRAGTVLVSQALQTLKDNYKGIDPSYPGIVGISVVLQPGSHLSVDDLTLRNHFRHKKVSHATFDAIHQAIKNTGFEIILYFTPNLPLLPDHHSLAVQALNGPIEPELPDAVGLALIATLQVVDNPHIYS